MDIAAILTNKFSGTLWVLLGDDYSGLDWRDTSPKPTEKALEALWPEVEYDLKFQRAQKARARVYRETSDPIFFEYQRGDKTEAEWLAAVQAVKDSNPYPETV